MPQVPPGECAKAHMDGAHDAIRGTAPIFANTSGMEKQQLCRNHPPKLPVAGTRGNATATAAGRIFLTGWAELGRLQQLTGKLKFSASRLLHAFTRPRQQPARLRLSHQYLRGRGIEIGALHNPLPVSRHAKVLYVDRISNEELLTHYPELGAHPLVPVDIIDDGETLATFSPASQDFIICNHFIEHTQDPIGTIKRQLKVLRPGGIIYMAVPEKNFSFDKDRPLTDYNHLVKDHVDGPQWSHEDHLREYARLAANVPEPDVEGYVNMLRSTSYSIHFHVWTQDSFLEFIRVASGHFDLKMEVADFEPANETTGEFVCIFRKNT